MATINSGSIGDMYLQIDYTVTQNVSNNTSTVRATLKLVNHYALYMSTMGGSYLSIGGQKVDYSKTISYGGSTTTTTTLYGPRDFVITHNSDGTASCNLTGTFVMNGTYRGYTVGTMTVNKTIALPKIARASGIEKFTNTGGTNLTSTDTGVAFRVYWTPASSEFKFRMQCVSPGGTFTYPSGTTFFEPKSTSSYYTTITTGHNWLPSQTSHRMEVRLYTYNSAGIQIGSTQTSYLTLNVPSHIGPSINSFVVESVDGMNGLSIRGKSRVKLTANATPGSGATMATYTFSGSNVNETDGSSLRTVYNPANSSVISTGVLNYIGAATYIVTVADMRGRKASASLSIEVFEYSPPAITSMSVRRCDANGSLNENGSYAYVTVNSQYTTLYHNNMNYNSRTVVLTNNANSYSATVQNTSNTNDSWSGVYGNGTFAAGTTYTITATIKDTAYGSSASMSQPLKAAARPMNIKSNGKGIGFGKMAETDNLLDVQWNERVRGNLQVDGALTTTGNINGVKIGLDNYVLGGSKDNITDENWVSSSPSFIGTYSQGNQWYNTVSLRHRNGREDGTSYGMQLRSTLTQQDNLSWRQQTNGSWGNWKTILDSSNTADYVVEQGTQGDWTYRKWNNGFAECWRNVSVTPSTVNGTNSISMSLPFTFANTDYNVTITPAKAAMYIDRWGDCATNGAITHTITNFTMAYNYAFGTAYAVSFNVVVNGRWK